VADLQLETSGCPIRITKLRCMPLVMAFNGGELLKLIETVFKWEEWSLKY